MDDASEQTPNQRLAERIGQIREANGSLEALTNLDDALVPLLLAYRRTVERGAEAPSPERSRRLWDRIETEIEAPAPSSQPPDRSRDGRGRTDREPVRSASRSVVWRTAVGVGLLLLVGITAWLWTRPSGPVLVAEAQNAVVTYETARGDSVRLRPHSRLFRRDASTSRFRLEGEAQFVVRPRTAEPFTVEADGALIRVLGTRFTVRTWTSAPTVFLSEGRVALRSLATGDSVAMRPGDRGTVGPDGTLSVHPADAAPYTDWLEGRLTFDSRPARSVAAELEQHYGIRLDLPDSVAAQSLTGRLLLDRRELVLDDFGRALGGRFEQRDGTFRFRAD